MAKDEHYTRLERMYLAAPVNELYKPTIDIGDAEATIEIEVSEQFFHAAHAVHGSVYFKMLDDAAFFAANSLERENFVLTASFTTYLTRPITSGRIRAVGKVVNETRTQFIAESVAYNDDGKEIGRGNGIFVRGRLPLTDAMAYADEA